MTLSKIFIPLFTFIHLAMLFFAVLVGLGSKSVGGTVFSALAVAGIIFYWLGRRLLTRLDSDQRLLKRGYMFMMLGCIPLLPVSLIFGFIPARLLARQRGFFEVQTIGQASLGQTYYYTRKILGPIPFWLGVAFVLIVFIALANGATGAAVRLGTGTLVLLLLGNANRKPRLIVAPEFVEVKPASFSPTQRLAFSEIAGITNDQQFIITLKSGAIIKLAKFEFSKKTRESFAAHMRSLL